MSYESEKKSLLDEESNEIVDGGPASTSHGALSSAYVSPEAALKLGWWPITAMLLIGFSEALVLTGTVLLLRDIIDLLIIQRAPTQVINMRLLVLIGLALTGGLVRVLEFGITESVGYRFVERLRMIMYAHLQRMPLRRLLNNSRGAILLRFTGDLTTIRTWISRGIARSIVAGTTLFAALLILALLYFPMISVVFGIILLGGTISLYVGIRLRRLARHVRRQRANLTTNLTEQIHSMASIQAFGRFAGEYDRLGRQNANLTKKLLRFAWLRAYLRGISTATGGIAIVGVLLIGVIGVDAGRLTIGDVVAAVLVVRYMMRPLRTLGLSHDYWQSAKVSREKVLTFLRRPYREVNEGLEPLRVQGGRIELKNIVAPPALQGVSATVEPRQIVAIMGANGAGKTSLLSVVGRIIEPDSGIVLVDGQDINKTTLKSCARHISMMTPILPLLRGTLRRNLLYRWRDAPAAELERVIKLCDLSDVIKQLPYGLDSSIKEGGANLAAGYAARVALARALVGQPKILLLDEPTASLDKETKQLLGEVILRYQGTVLLVTHDPEEAAMADVIWKMEAGRVVEILSGDEYRLRIAPTVWLPPWTRVGNQR